VLKSPSAEITGASLGGGKRRGLGKERNRFQSGEEGGLPPGKGKGGNYVGEGEALRVSQHV